MKKILLMGAIGLSVFSFGQIESNPVQYTEVVKISDSSKTAKQLYASAKMWFTKSFKNPKDVLALDDSDNSILVGKGTMRYNSKIFMGSGARQGFISFDVNIACKDGRYKYEIGNFQHTGNNSNYGIITTDEQLPTMTSWNTGPENFRKKVTKEIKDMIDENIKPLIDLLKAEMDKKPISKEDW